MTSASARRSSWRRRGKGIEPGTAGYRLLDGWLRENPDPILFDAWRAYITELASSLVPGQRGLLKSQILAFAQTVAESAGGFLGMKTVSAAEKAALADIESAFGDILFAVLDPADAARAEP